MDILSCVQTQKIKDVRMTNIKSEDSKCLKLSR